MELDLLGGGVSALQDCWFHRRRLGRRRRLMMGVRICSSTGTFDVVDAGGSHFFSSGRSIV